MKSIICICLESPGKSKKIYNNIYFYLVNKCLSFLKTQKRLSKSKKLNILQHETKYFLQVNSYLKHNLYQIHILKKQLKLFLDYFNHFHFARTFFNLEKFYLNPFQFI